jgi:hypothetical protein
LSVCRRAEGKRLTADWVVVSTGQHVGMQRQSAADYAHNARLIGHPAAQPRLRPYYAVTAEENAQQGRFNAIPVARELRQLSLVTVILFGKVGGAEWVGLDDPRDEPIGLSSL